MTVSKHITINLGNYESLKIGVDEAASYENADKVILAELDRMNIHVSDRIRQVLCDKGIIGSWTAVL